MKETLKILSILLLMSNSLFALSTEIEFDILKMKLATELKENQYEDSLVTMQKIKNMGIELPSSFAYFEAKSLFESGEKAKSYKKFESYIEHTGRGGKYYQQAISYLIKAEEFKKLENLEKIGNLMYQNQPFTKKYKWKEAERHCQGLTLGGYSDWRLPTRAELHKISNVKMYGEYDNGWEKWFDKNKHRRFKNSKGESHFIDKRFIENMPKYSYFWTSTLRDSSNAWLVDFYYGNNSWLRKTDDFYALCVR